LPPRVIRSRKPTSVRLSQELCEFLSCCENEWLRNKMDEVLSQLSEDYQLGGKIPPERWSRHARYYITRWKVRNIYECRVGPDWRLTYTLLSDGAGAAVVALEVVTHKEYDRLFGYRTT